MKNINRRLEGLLNFSNETMEDTHTRSTFLVENGLLERLNKLAKEKRNGFKTEFINTAIENTLIGLEELEKEQRYQNRAPLELIENEVREEREMKESLEINKKNHSEESTVTNSRESLVFYSDPDIAKILQGISEKDGNAAKSDIINIALRKYFEEQV